MKIIIPLICALLAGCNSTPKECEEIVKSHLDEAKFWVRSIAYAKDPVDENTCNAVVTAISMRNTWNSDDVIYFENKIIVGSHITRYGDGTYTHVTLSKVSDSKKTKPVVPSDSLAKSIADSWDAKMPENDMCTGIANAVVRGDNLGSGQYYCAIPVAISIYERERI